MNSEIIKSISITGNDRITDETIIVFSNVSIGDDLSINDLDTILKDLYNTDFFKNISVKIKNNVLNIDLIENSLVQNVEINGVKKKNLNKLYLNS